MAAFTRFQTGASRPSFRIVAWTAIISYYHFTEFLSWRIASVWGSLASVTACIFLKIKHTPKLNKFYIYTTYKFNRYHYILTSIIQKYILWAQSKLTWTATFTWFQTGTGWPCFRIFAWAALFSHHHFAELLCWWIASIWGSLTSVAAVITSYDSFIWRNVDRTGIYIDNEFSKQYEFKKITHI